MKMLAAKLVTLWKAGTFHHIEGRGFLSVSMSGMRLACSLGDSRIIEGRPTPMHSHGSRIEGLVQICGNKLHSSLEITNLRPPKRGMRPYPRCRFRYHEPPDLDLVKQDSPGTVKLGNLMLMASEVILHLLCIRGVAGMQQPKGGVLCACISSNPFYHYRWCKGSPNLCPNIRHNSASFDI